MATFTPEKEENLQNNFPVLPDGRYEFEVFDAVDTTSKSGNDMIEITLKVFGPKGEEVRVFDYLTFTPKSQWKPYSFCKAVGLVEKFKAGELAALDCQGKRGTVDIDLEPASGQYKEKNKVAGYVELKEAPKPLTKAEKDDDIPF